MRLSRQALAAGHLPTPMPHARPLRKGFTEQELSYAPASDDCDACTFFAGKLGRFSQCGQFSQFDKSNDQQLRFAHLQTKSHLLLNALARKRTGKAPPATKHKKIVFAAKKPKPSRPRPRWAAGLLGCWAAGLLAAYSSLAASYYLCYLSSAWFRHPCICASGMCKKLHIPIFVTEFSSCSNTLNH